MFKKIILIFLSFVAFLSLIQGQDTGLVFQPAALDLGTIKPRGALTRTVLLHNKGTTSIQLLSTKTDCGCTVASPAVSTLGAGDSTTLEVKFDSQGMTGQIFREVRVITDRGTISLPIKVYVNPFGGWRADSSSVTFPSSKSESKQDATLSFVHAVEEGQPSPRIDAAWSPAPWLEVIVLPAKTPGRYTLKLTRLPNAPAGTLQTVVNLKVNTSGETLALPVIAQVKGLVTVYPNPITMGTGIVGQPRHKQVTLEGWAGVDPPLLFVPQGTIKFHGIKDGRLVYLLTVIPEAAGILQLSMQVCPPDTQLVDGLIPSTTAVIADVPVIIRALQADK
jgi:hypothetical protein